MGTTPQSNLPTVIERGQVARQDFTGTQVQSQAETSIAAVTAREEAIIKSEYVMAERHPRVWMDVRAQMLDHCKRPRFAEIARYAKPVGKKKNPNTGEWEEQHARGFSARFAETLAQEMGNIKPWSSVAYEDDLLKIVRIGVTDLQKNLPRAREVTFAKTVEKRGKFDKRTKEWAPPEGREIIGQPRINSYGDPTWTVKATDDEMRNKVNSEESKTQRDFIIKFCPRDILDECEEQILTTLESEDQKDPTAALKRLLDSFRNAFGVMPSDLERYVGKASAQFAPADIRELRELGMSIKDGQTTFAEALQLRRGPSPDGEEVEESETTKKLRDRLDKARKQPEPPKSTAPASQAHPPTALKPPTHIEDQEDFSPELYAWQKVKGVLYYLDPEGGNYKVYEPAKK